MSHVVYTEFLYISKSSILYLYRILKMQEKGRLEALRKKWFERDSMCKDEGGSGKSESRAGNIGMDQIAGAFFVLMMGAVFSFVIVIIEHIWYNSHKPSLYQMKEKESGRSSHTVVSNCSF